MIAEEKMVKMPYYTVNQNNILPENLHKAAIKFAKEKTGIDRPVKEHKVYIEIFQECFKLMRELGMLKEEFLSAVDGKKRDDT